MSPDDKSIAAMLRRLKRSCNVRRIMKELKLSPCEVRACEFLDALLRLEDAFIKGFGGPAQFTGNNRVYVNGAVGYEVRCKKCHKTFWVTAIPYAFCPDCDNTLLGR